MLCIFFCYYIPREDAASPTMSTETVFMTTLMDAMEGHEVAVVDIPGAFMQVDMDVGAYMQIDGTMAELMLEINEDLYQPYVIKESNKLVIHVELLIVLCGTV